METKVVNYNGGDYDVIVVGAGHAGSEAAPSRCPDGE